MKGQRLFVAADCQGDAHENVARPSPFYESPTLLSVGLKGWTVQVLLLLVGGPVYVVSGGTLCTTEQMILSVNY